MPVGLRGDATRQVADQYERGDHGVGVRVGVAVGVLVGSAGQRLQFHVVAVPIAIKSSLPAVHGLVCAQPTQTMI